MSLEQYNHMRQAANTAGAFVAVSIAKTITVDLLLQAIAYNQLDDPVVDVRLRNKIDKRLQERTESENVLRQEFLMSYILAPLPAEGPLPELSSATIPDTNRLDAEASVAVYNHSYDTVVHVVMYVPRLHGLVAAGNSLTLDRLLYDFQPQRTRSVMTDKRDEEVVLEIDDVLVADKGILYVLRHPLTSTSFAINLVSDFENYQKFRSKFSKAIVELPLGSVAVSAIENAPYAMRNYCAASAALAKASMPHGYQDISKEDFDDIDEVIRSLLYDEDRFFSDLLCRDVGVRLLAAECGLDCNVSSFDFELANKLQLARYLAICLNSVALKEPLPEIPEWAPYLTRCT